jgi:hypothetical protein
MKPAQLLSRILAGAVTNVGFDDLVRLIEALGFNEISRRGSHRVFGRHGVLELINLQEVQGQAKPYQVRQVVTLVRRYDLTVEADR